MSFVWAHVEKEIVPRPRLPDQITFVMPHVRYRRQ
jgi:hypothetical protein